MTVVQRPRRQRMPSAERAADLRRVAEATFLDIGFHGASMSEIARRAGVTRAILYRHYTSKDELAAACLAASRRYLQTLVDSDAGDLDPREAMRAGSRQVMRFIGEHSRLFSIFLADDTFTGSEVRAEAEAIRDDLEQAARAALRRAAPDVDPAAAQLIARGLVGAGSRVAEGLDWTHSTPAELDQIADAAMALLWNGLGGLTTR
ncbi:TetR/AcrR family transcriptional regulator [Mycolicibacterium fortuitum]|uniref:TetR/AcrR family transcriptional regulator n=1 Tax=Mycolicibacterium fortuitum TaxID=1766 RepID=UPI0022BA464C|nr:TetR/AcrR family transcriptional regulator [Mycolicibacterium fortuitum]WAY19751.1 TetR/AcrR family transcriptional regulator [Mycolicibacterium fortuitum]